jgi:hypothetical protein
MTDKCISPLRRRMIEDMTVRNFAAKTQHDYVQRRLCSIGRVRSRVRPVDAARIAAGPNALRGSGPNRFTRTRKCDDPSGFSRSPERPYLHYVVMPSPIRCNPRSTLDYAACESNLGSLKRSPRTIMAQAIRAILLASATAATLIGRRS